MHICDSPRAFAVRTRRAVLRGAWDQTVVSRPVGEPHRHCDVGTKLAIAFGRVRTFDDARIGPHYMSRDGRDAACEAMGLDLRQLKDLFYVCGVSQLYLTGPDLGSPATWSHNPKSKWPLGREIVWNRLAVMGVMPAFDGRRRVRPRTAAVVTANWRFWVGEFGIDVRARMDAHDRTDAFWRQLSRVLAQPQLIAQPTYRTDTALDNRPVPQPACPVEGDGRE